MSNNSKTILYVIGAVATIIIVWLILDNKDLKLKLADLQNRNDEKVKSCKQQLRNQKTFLLKSKNS
jgi:hypothetical protein